MRKNLQEITDLIEKFECEEDDEIANPLIRNIIFLIEQLIETSENYYNYYLLGYAWYISREESTERINNIKNNLLQSIKLNSNYCWSKLYLGHLYFDIESYDNALMEFKSIKFDDFYEVGQKWRVLKIKELILCCKIYLNNGSFDINELLQLINLYVSTNEIDRPVPLEIITCINKEELLVNDKIKIQLGNL
jgi:hypothetical protein